MINEKWDYIIEFITSQHLSWWEPETPGMSGYKASFNEVQFKVYQNRLYVIVGADILTLDDNRIQPVFDNIVAYQKSKIERDNEQFLTGVLVKCGIVLRG